MALTQERLKQLFEYQDDGTFVRLKNGKPVICNPTRHHRYLRVSVDGKPVALHRCVFLYHHSYLPEAIDHADGDRMNNRIENLREATQQQNCLNRVKHSNGKNAYKNVYLDKRFNKWLVQVNVNGKRKFFGSYDDIELADLVATEARNTYHGNFVNHGGVL